MELDVLFIADPRFQGGTSTGLAAEIRACRRASLSCGLRAIKSPVIRRSRPVQADLAALIDDGALPFLHPDAPVSARVAVVHHPQTFTHLPARRLAVDAGSVVLVLHHPEVDAAGAIQYDLAAITRNIAVALGGPAILAPVGPAVRASLRQPLPDGVRLASDDWLQLIDCDAFPFRPRRPVAGGAIVVGRHSRPEAEKFPDDRATALAVYPDAADIRVRMLGADAATLGRLYGPLPRGWECLTFGSAAVADFLAGLHVYVYAHASHWTEAFGRAPLEAMAAGVPTILPRAFEPLFGPAALYADPDGVEPLVRALAADADAMERQARAARALIEERFGLHRYAARIEALAGPPPPRPAPSPPPVGRSRAPDRILFVTSNGVGLGHVTRALAIAGRLPAGLQPVFFTLSKAVKLIRDAGHLAEYAPFHRGLAADPERWNAVFAEELDAMLAFYRPSALVFDGNVPYRGLIDGLAEHPEVMSVWVRRAMWSGLNGPSLAESGAFDGIIEPGEAAGAYDTGPTAREVANVHRVPPILQRDGGDRLGRDAARAALGVGPDRLLVALQLGAGNNFDFERLRADVLAALAAQPRVDIVEFVSPVADRILDPSGPRHRIRAAYPSYDLSAAFDLQVSAAGYNSFHEAIACAIPTVFVPNEAGEMDLQIVRARFADRAGFGRLLRVRDHHRAAETLAELLDEGTRDGMRRVARRYAFENGAGAAARFIADLARFTRADRDTMSP